MSKEEVKRSQDVVVDGNISFDSLFLSKDVLQGLKDNDFLKPSPIQLKAIPLGKCGFDLIIKSKSGTGKTAVFAIIALEMIDTKMKHLQVVILGPTREIAVQTCDVISSIGKYISDLKVSEFIGGLPLSKDKEKASNCQIAVGSPGRLLHLIKLGVLCAKKVKLLVLDEADNLMDANYQANVNQIYHFMPKNKQMLALSATFAHDLDVFLAGYMQMPSLISADMSIPILLGLKQFVTITKFNGNVLHMLNHKNCELLRLLTHISFTQCLIFCNYQTRAEEICSYLNSKSWKSNFISAAQTQVQRLECLSKFKKFQCRILLSTDLTARGIDAVNVDLVINYDVPHNASTYLHRMGRAGRYGTKGLCISIASKGKELTKLSNIIGEIGGVDMCIPILPKQDVFQNIWEANQTDFEVLNGNIKDVNDDNQLEIANSIKTLRSQREKDSGETGKIKQSVKETDKSVEDREEVKVVDDTQRLLMKLAAGEETSYEQAPIRNADENFTKNVSLLSVSQLLQSDDINDDDPVVIDTIERFVTSLKNADVASVPFKDDKCEMVEPNIDDLLMTAYDHAIDNSKPHWADMFNIEDCGEGVDELNQEGTNLMQDLLEYAANDAESEYDNYNNIEEYKNDSEMVSYHDETSKEQMASNWHPVVEKDTFAENKTAYFGDDEYDQLYKSSIDKFNARFNTLETMDDFQASWKAFQDEMKSIREYMEQNIYVAEMSAYKSCKNK